MTDPRICPTCGAALAADAPGSACPKCLLQAGFATGGSAALATGGRAPTPQELAPRFPGLVIETLLGRGGMGVVYKARHKALDREVALKVLPAALAGDASFAERFQREARALAKLQHPNIVAVHDFGESVGDDGGGLFWLVMEYVDGTNIRQAMRAGQIHPKEALAIVPQICDALQYAHEHGVVHRDIKPENVLLDKSGRVKVADFGLAKMMEAGAADRTLTGAGQVMGTPHYMAPEQVEHPKDVDHRADIYSLGVVFYEMLTGELPLGRFAAPSDKCDVDARIDEIVLRTLEKEREARYQRVDEVKTDVGRATAASGGAPAQGAMGADGTGAHLKAGGWEWRHPDPEHPEARLSRLALASALAFPAALLLGALGYVVGSLFGTDDESAWIGVAIAFWGSLAGGGVLGVVSWGQIRHSGGRLHGVPLAVIGTVVSALSCACGGPALLMVTSHESGPDGPEQASPLRHPIVDYGVDGQRVIQAYLQLQAMHGKPSFTFGDAVALYAPSARTALREMLAEERDRLGRAGGLGLPLLDASHLRGYSLASFKVTGASFPMSGDAPARARVTAEYGGMKLHFRLESTTATAEDPGFERMAPGARVWYFGTDPVEIE